MGQIAAVNIANGSGIIHCQRGWEGDEGKGGREGDRDRDRETAGFTY